MTIPNLNIIQNQTPADAVPVNENFQNIQSHINTNLIDKDGSIAMTGSLILSDGNPAISSAEADALLPVGLMMDWPAASPPAGGDWVLCNGQILTTADYPALQALLGGIYDEPGDSFGGTQFRVPNLNGRSSVGPGGDLGGALADQAGRADSNAPAHTHTGPSHSHSINHGHGDNISASQSGHQHSFSATTSSDSHSHDTTLDTDTVYAAGTDYNAAYSPPPSGTSVTTASDSHTHTVSGTTGSATPTITISGGVTNHTGSSGTDGTGNTGSTGDGGPTDNYGPVLVLNKIIKAR